MPTGTNQGSGEWVRVCGAEDVVPDSVREVKIGNLIVAIYRIDGRLFATSGVCTHAFALLSEGFLEGDVIECPIHQARFHVPTGKALSGPAIKGLDCFAVRERDGGIYLGLGAAECGSGAASSA